MRMRLWHRAVPYPARAEELIGNGARSPPRDQIVGPVSLRCGITAASRLPAGALQPYAGSWGAGSTRCVPEGLRARGRRLQGPQWCGRAGHKHIERGVHLGAFLHSTPEMVSPRESGKDVTARARDPHGRAGRMSP